MLNPIDLTAGLATLGVWMNIVVHYHAMEIVLGAALYLGSGHCGCREAPQLGRDSCGSPPLTDRPDQT